MSKKKKKIVITIVSIVLLIAIFIALFWINSKNSSPDSELTTNQQISEWSEVYDFKEHKNYNTYEDKYLPPVTLE